MTCGKGARHRQVLCILGDEEVDEQRCDPNTKPSAVGGCELPECASWQVGAWSPVRNTRSLGCFVRFCQQTFWLGLMCFSARWAAVRAIRGVRSGVCQELTARRGTIGIVTQPPDLETVRWTNTLPFTISNVFTERRLFCSQRLHLFDQTYSKNCDMLLPFKTAVFCVNVC